MTSKALILATILAFTQSIAAADVSSSLRGEHESAAEDQPRRRLSVPSNDPSAPGLAWLLSFPGSGTEQVVDFLQGATGKTTATNYGNQVQNQFGRNRMNMVTSTPVYSDKPEGPFLFTSHLAIPDSHIATVTFCDAYCTDCPPSEYIIDLPTFKAGCANGMTFQPEVGPRGPIGRGTSGPTSYDLSKLTKAVVLMRDPFNVVQDRFATWTHSYTDISHRDHEWLPRYTTNAEGFDSYCDYSAIKYATEEQAAYDNDIFDASLGVKCHADIYRYVHWYNLVFEMLNAESIPYTVLHYEDIGNDYQGAENNLLSTLGLTAVNPAPVFVSHGDHGYFTSSDKTALKALIQLLASTDTLNNIGRYLV